MVLQSIKNWYARNLFLNQLIVAVLFGWQLLHLYWLTTHVLATGVLGYPLFSPSDIYEKFLVLADYAEIPALISGTLLYLHFSNEKFSKKNILFLLMINSQWLHLFWITDEFVVDAFGEKGTILPVWLAWLAIIIDYLELPVIYDTIKNVIKQKLVKRVTS